MAVDGEPSQENQIDDEVVERYFDGAGGTAPEAMSMMAHEHNLPPGAVAYRLSRELRTVGPGLHAVSMSGRVRIVGRVGGA